MGTKVGCSVTFRKMASKKTQSRKYQLAEELEGHFDNFKKALIVQADNVGSNQLHEIRKALRGKVVIYCGKNTQMRRVIRKLIEAGRIGLEPLVGCLQLNVALVFTNENLGDMRDLLKQNYMPAAAKAGSIAQVDVSIEKGITSLEPGTPTLVSVPYSILLAYANLLAIAAETDMSFKQADSVRKFLGK